MIKSVFNKFGFGTMSIHLHLRLRSLFRSIDPFYYPTKFHSSMSVQDSAIMTYSKNQIKYLKKPLFNSDSRLQELFGIISIKINNSN